MKNQFSLIEEALKGFKGYPLLLGYQAEYDKKHVADFIHQESLVEYENEKTDWDAACLVVDKHDVLDTEKRLVMTTAAIITNCSIANDMNGFMNSMNQISCEEIEHFFQTISKDARTLGNFFDSEILDSLIGEWTQIEVRGLRKRIRNALLNRKNA